MSELSPKLWKEAWIYFKDKPLKQCGEGVHPVNEMCALCYNKASP